MLNIRYFHIFIISLYIITNIYIVKIKKYYLVIYTIFVTTKYNSSRYLIQNIILRRLKYLKSSSCNSILFTDEKSHFYSGIETFSIPKYIIPYNQSEKMTMVHQCLDIL